MIYTLELVDGSYIHIHISNRRACVFTKLVLLHFVYKVRQFVYLESAVCADEKHGFKTALVKV